MSAVPDRIATDLLRVALNPATGRFPHATALDSSLRAALLADLVLRGRITDVNNAPSVISAEPTGDRILDAMRAAVENHEGVTWRRWFSHVSGDRKALSKELVAAGIWTIGPGWRASYVDSDSDAALALTMEVDRVTRLERPAADPREAVLAVLAVCSGATGSWPRPGAVKRDLAPLVRSIDHPTVEKLVNVASRMIRRARRGRSMA
jgi:hypothetical protein